MSNDPIIRPVLGVHVLTEFVFCERAGLVSRVEKTLDTGVELSVSNLDYMPFYELKEIDQALAKLQTRASWLCGAICLLIIAASITSANNWLLALLLLASTCFLIANLLSTLVRGYQIYSEKLGFLNTRSQTPDLTNLGDEELDWRALIRHGFDIGKPIDQFIDRGLGLAGRPWKLLKIKNTCIPVFKCRATTPKNPEGQRPSNWLYKQHYVRIEAYCQLIQSCTNYEAPCGIVLFSGSYRAFVIKPSAATNESLAQALDDAWNAIGQFEFGGKPQPPEKRICRGCKRGLLSTYSLDSPVIQKMGADVVPNLHNIEGRKCHSLCGDLFEWTPPHEKSIRLGLADK